MAKTEPSDPDEKLRVFLDSSALFAGIWSATGGGRAILKLGEVGALVLLVNSQVLAEIEAAFSRKAPELLTTLAFLLEQSGIQIVDSASAEYIELCTKWVGYQADAKIVAAAWESQVDFMVTLDREHFLSNQMLKQELPFPIGTPGDFLALFRTRLLSR